MSPVPYPESSLVSGLREGRPDAFSRLYDQYAAVLFGIINRIVADDRKATALLAATFKTVCSRIDQYRPECQPLFPWLLAIARESAASALAELGKNEPGIRRLNSADDRLTLVADQPTSRLNALSPVVELNRATHKQLLDSILFLNCSPEEATGSVGNPVGNARQQVREALLQLRKQAADNA